MKKRLIALIICAAMLLTLFPCAAAAGKYDPKPAIAWATNKKSFEAYDGKCAAFVSACFRKGGLSDVKESAVGDLMNYIEKKKYGTIVTANDTNLKKLKPGDAIAVACSKKHGSSYYGKHVIFVVSVDQKNKKITYCAKNNDRFKQGMSFSSIKSYDNNWNKGKCSKCGASLKTYLILMENVEPRTAGTLQFYGNYSGKNYLYQGDFSGTLDADYYFSRDTSVSKLSIDGSTRHDGFPSLKIVNTSAGSSGKDLCIKTLTNQCRNNYSVGDSKNMTLSFWAKSSVDGNTFCVRWGFQSDYKTVKLSKDWTRYTVSLPKTTAYNNCLHPYVGKAGTVWMTQMQLEDGTAATDYVSESQGLYATTQTAFGKPYNLPAAPTRDGYSFDGWYTAVSGGTKVSASTVAGEYDMCVYAHWVKNHAHSYLVKKVVSPTCTNQGYTTYTCSCGDSYKGSYTRPLGHDYGEWKVTTAPTCTAKGVESRFCSRCSASETRSIPAMTHNYKASVVKPTASKQGYTLHKCSVCGYSYKDKYTVAAPTVTLSSVASTGRIKLTWAKIAGADKYYIYRSTDGKSYQYVTSTTKLSYTDSKTTAGKKYYYKLKAVTADGTKSAYSAAKYRTCDLAKVTVKITTSKGDPKLSWEKVTNATKYEVYRATSKSGEYTKLTTTTKTSYVNTSAKPGKTYYYKVRAVCGVSAAAGAYSSVVSIKAK